MRRVLCVCYQRHVWQFKSGKKKKFFLRRPYEVIAFFMYHSPTTDFKTLFPYGNLNL